MTTAAATSGQSEPSIRPIERADLLACADVFYDAQDELYTRNAVPLLPRDPPAMAAFFERLMAGGPAHAHVFERPDQSDLRRVGGFGIAVERDDLWFLSFLFVRPDVQARGVGRDLLEACWSRSGPTIGTRATCVDSVQPVSTGMYARSGIVPRVPIFTLTGTPRQGRVGELPLSVSPVPFAELAEAGGHAGLVAAVEEIDRELLGFTRAEDHRQWRLSGRQGVLYRTADTGRPVGYGYVQASGRLGPVAVDDPELVPGVLADLMTRVRPVGPWDVLVAGVTETAIVPLLQAGLRFDGHPGIYCATRAGVSFERYLPASFALI